MKHSSADYIRGCFGCAILLVLVSGALGADNSVSNAFGAFGFVYGGLWLQHE